MGCEFGSRDGTAVDSGSMVRCNDGPFQGTPLGSAPFTPPVPKGPEMQAG